MVVPLKTRQENHAQDVFTDWVGRMMAITPIDDWGWELKWLLETWYERDGVLFTQETYRQLQEWMAAEQEVAWEGERRFGTSDDGPIQLASNIASNIASDIVSDDLPARLLFDRDAFQFFDPHTGRRISEEEILAFGAEEAAPPPEPVGFDALFDFMLPPDSLLDEDFGFEPLFGPPELTSFPDEIEAAKQRDAELEAAEEQERAPGEFRPPLIIVSREQGRQIYEEERRREIERLRAEGVIVPEEPPAFDLMLEGAVGVVAGPLGKPVAQGVKTGATKGAGFLRRLWRRLRGVKDEAADAAKQASKQADEVGEAGKKLATKKSESARSGGTAKQRNQAKTRPPAKVRGPYSHLDDPPSVGPGKNFTPTQTAKIIEANKARNGGVVRSDVSGKSLRQPGKSKKGVTPAPEEWQIDHVTPKSKGGTNSYSNAQVTSRAENRLKSSK